VKKIGIDPSIITQDYNKLIALIKETAEIIGHYGQNEDVFKKKLYDLISEDQGGRNFMMELKLLHTPKKGLKKNVRLEKLANKLYEKGMKKEALDLFKIVGD